MAEPGREAAGAGPGMLVALWFCVGQALLLGATRGLFFAPADPGGEPPSQAAVFALLHLASGVVLLRSGLGGALRLALRAWPVALLAAAALLVLAWTPDPALAWPRSLAFLGSLVFALAAARSLRPEAMLRLMLRTNVVLLLLSLLAIVALPDTAYSSDDRGRFWQGVFFHKNAFGLFLLFHLVLCAHAAWTRRAGALELASGALALVLLPGTGSATPFLAAAAVVAAAVARPALSAAGARERNLRFLAALALLAPVGWALWMAADPLLSALGRDPTLTGRTDLWRVLLRDHAEHMLLGRGIACFWLDPAGPVDAVHRSLPWIALSAHNGYLDTLLSLGVPGLAGLLALLALAWARADRLPWPGLARALVALLAVYDCFESQIVRHNEWFTVLALLLACTAAAAPDPRARPEAR